MSKQPFLPLFFGDFLASTAEWTGEERSLYLTLLGYQWSLGSLPAEPEKLRRVVQWEAKLFRQCWPTVAGKFTEVDGRLLNHRLELHREKSEEIAKLRSEIGRRGGQASVASKRQAKASAEVKQPSTNGNGFAEPNSNHPSHTIFKNPPTPRKRGGAQGSKRCPEGFEPDLDFARREVPGIDAEAEAAKFRDFEFAKPRSDWPATWRNWIRTARDRGTYAKVAAAPGAIQWQ